MIRRLSLILLEFILLYATEVYAQSFQSLEINNGLSQPSVMAIGQDILGRMWFGTREGINVYDGVKIKSYKGEIENGDQGKLWIGNSVSYIVGGNSIKGSKVYFISDFCLYSYDVRTELFAKVDQSGEITAIAPYKGNILYAQKNNVFFYDIERSQKSIFKILPEATSVNVIITDEKNMYLGTTDGVIVSPLSAIWEEMHILKGEDIYRIYKDSRRNLWIGTRMKGLYRIVGGKMTKVPVCPNGVGGVIDPQIREFVEDDDGNIWFGTFMGLQKYDEKKHEYTTVRIPQYAGGLNHPSIFSLFKDRQGNIWTGSYFGGVNYFNPTQHGIIHYDYQIKVPSSLYYSYIGEMVFDKRNRLWVSTDGGGISCLGDYWETLMQFTSDVENKHSGYVLPHNNIKSLCYDGDNDMLYIGTHLGGLSRYDIQKGEFYNYLTMYPDAGNMPGSIIHHVKKWNGYIVISSREGVFCLDTKSNKFTKLPKCFGEAFIFDISEDGVFYTARGNNIRAVSMRKRDEAEDIDLHIKGDIAHILAANNKLYICTLGSGFLVYDVVNKKLTTYSLSNSSLPSNYCYASQLTSNGKLVLTSDKGISMFDIRKKTFMTIKQKYLKAPIIFGCGICISSDNVIYVGDTKGITRVEENDFMSPLQVRQSIYFSDIYVNNDLIQPSESGGILHQSLAFTPKISLSSVQNNIIINFASSDYVKGHVQQIFEYKLEGLDKTWFSTSIPSARYTNLSPGHYTLYVKIMGGSSADMAVLDIYISSPWYNTWWAWSLYIIIFIAVVWMVMWYKNEKNKLSYSLEKERFEKQHIEELNHEKFVFFTNVSHEFRTPLTLIISHIESLLQMPFLSPAVYNRVIKLKQNAEYMNGLVSELLDFRKFTQNKYILNLSEGNMCAFVKEIFYTYTDYANSKHLQYDFSADNETIMCWFDARQLEKVFLNLLSNAFKYTKEGHIEIKIYTDDTHVHIAFCDTGSGISVDDSQRIFDRFYQIVDKSYTSGLSGTGIGLALTKSIVEKHHGKIELQSKVGEGSIFTVTLPLERAEYSQDEHVRFVEAKDEHVKPSERYDGLQEEMQPDSGVAVTEPIDGSENTSHFKVLIVEDNNELLQVLNELFAPFYQTIMARNGKEGLEKVIEYKPDLVISDIMMPEMSGTEMCLKIKNNIDLCHIPVILLTALNSVEQNIEGLNRGADDYITKPFNSNILLARANNLVRNRLLIQSQISKKPIAEVDLTSINPLDQAILRKTVDAIESHIDDTEFDVPELCKEIGMGRSALYAKFKSLTGMTPNNFILNHRLKFAASMLKQHPEMTVSEVGDKCGFSSPVYFSRCFKQQYGITPQNFRKNNSQ